jgi:predicted small secreted protein
MARKVLSSLCLASFLFTGVILISGCETAKGAAEGITYTAKETGRGAVKDVAVVGVALKKADDWMKENLW